MPVQDEYRKKEKNMVTTNLKDYPAEKADVEFIYIDNAGWLFIHLKTKDLNLMVPIEPKRVDELRETIKKRT